MSEQEVRPKHEVVITVRGAAGTGKTYLMRVVADALQKQGISVTLKYGLDGDPERSQADVDRIVSLLVDRIHVTVNEQSVRTPPKMRAYNG